MRGIVESPLAGDTVNNLRFALWCCRYLWGRHKVHAIASHMICPWFLDDSIPAEREAGIDWDWVWQPGVRHWFFGDLGWSSGMSAARDRCNDLGIGTNVVSLGISGSEYWVAFQRGEWPPHTQGFRIGGYSEQEQYMLGVRDGSSRS